PDSDPNDPDTWVGYGEYEPDIDDDTKWHLTLRNVHIKAFTLVHAYNPLFGHPGRLLFSDMFVTLTTKAIGRKYTENANPFDDEIKSLVAQGILDDFGNNDIFITDNGSKYWLESEVQNQFTTSKPNEGDDIDCDPRTQPDHCRGNFEYNTQDFSGKLMHAGEPCNFENKAQCLLVGLSSFHGKNQLAPVFARELPDGRGQALYFTFHGCLLEPEISEEGQINLGPEAGCEEGRLDDPDIMRQYVAAGMLENKNLDPDPEDLKTSKAYINYQIFNEDRQRYTNYYDFPNHFNFLNPDTRKRSPITRDVGYGM
ncbi:MAG TPA: hypothetical protein DDW49_03195, partial [Deltaproteobacteria bacterium]|nr:hypothetical protein [Deltaproteobacteria bacterium]